MTVDNSFVMIVEEDPKFELVIDLGNSTDIPKLFHFENRFYIQEGQYASPGNRFRYRRVEPVGLNYPGITTPRYSLKRG